MRVIVIPGMGCSPVATTNWYSWLSTSVSARPNLTCALTEFPDPNRCRERIWVPFVRDLIEKPSETILVGHSSGAACAMRLLEQDLGLKAVILVAAAHTDGGDAGERESEYFNRDWEWEKMKTGAERIVLFHGEDDHLIPVREARHIKEKLGESLEYREMKGKSHFFEPWPELLEVLDEVAGN